MFHCNGDGKIQAIDKFIFSLGRNEVQVERSQSRDVMGYMVCKLRDGEMLWLAVMSRLAGQCIKRYGIQVERTLGARCYEMLLSRVGLHASNTEPGYGLGRVSQMDPSNPARVGQVLAKVR
ncbi:hypothetical protein AMTR_s00046p00133750 [Amborella trichopoda]|uniref:Uncharacterized protein n=1 Tax=Amborella trichopoda TaxID=13333 RepID=U5D6X1_AMBTC|nr:hypothetical protein AMTR_s00046p00133750 [Amborella trichopoda]